MTTAPGIGWGGCSILNSYFGSWYLNELPTIPLRCPKFAVRRSARKFRPRQRAFSSLYPPLAALASVAFQVLFSQKAKHTRAFQHGCILLGAGDRTWTCTPRHWLLRPTCLPFHHARISPAHCNTGTGKSKQKNYLFFDQVEKERVKING